MKITLLLLPFVFLILTGCNQQTDQTDIVQQNQHTADDVVNSIVYIRDPRTDFCFAFYWGGSGNGGPALTLVPSNSIPSNLIWTAKIQ